jgi:uroporphyrinogen decarboxylase
MQFAAEYIGSNYAAFASDWRVLVEANLRCRADFDFDQVSAISDPYRETQGFGAEIRYEADHAPTCPHPPLSDIHDLSPLCGDPDPCACERMRDRLLAVRAFRNASAVTAPSSAGVEGPAAEAADLRGVQDFLMDLMDAEEIRRRLMETCHTHRHPLRGGAARGRRRYHRRRRRHLQPRFPPTSTALWCGRSKRPV